MVEPSIGGSGKDGLGPIRDAQARLLDHRQVVRAVADRHGLSSVKAERVASLDQRGALEAAVDDPTGDAPGQDAVFNAQHIGFHLLEPQAIRHRPGEGSETSRHKQGRNALRAQSSHERFSARIRPNPLPQALLQRRFGQPLEQSHSFPQRPNEIELTAHRPIGDLRNQRLHARIVGEFVNAFLADHGGIHIGHEEPDIATAWQGDKVNPFPALERGSGGGYVIDGKIGRATWLDPVKLARARHSIERRSNQSFVEPPGCYQGRNGQG